MGKGKDAGHQSDGQKHTAAQPQPDEARIGCHEPLPQAGRVAFFRKGALYAHGPCV